MDDWNTNQHKKSGLFEKDYIKGLTQIGIRNVSSTAKEGYVDAKQMGSNIISVRQFRRLGISKILEELPDNINWLRNEAK